MSDLRVRVNDESRFIVKVHDDGTAVVMLEDSFDGFGAAVDIAALRRMRLAIDLAIQEAER